MSGQIEDTSPIWVAFTNTDCTEGRGREIPLAVCALETTALRLGKGQYVQGTNCPVKALQKVKIGGNWYVPSEAVLIRQPTHEDIDTQTKLDDSKLAIAKAKANAAGLTDADRDAIAAMFFNVKRLERGYV